MKAIEIKINVDQTELDEALAKAKKLEQFERYHNHCVAQKLRNQLEKQNKALDLAVNVISDFIDACPYSLFEDRQEQIEELLKCENCVDDYEGCWKRFLTDEC